MVQPSDQTQEGHPVTHLFLSTTPFLILFSYFLYVAYERPSFNPNAGDDQAIIPLLDMLLSFLSMFVLWAILTVYLSFFIQKRRDLITQYGNVESSGGNVKTVLGDVYYERPNNFFTTLFGRCIRGYTDYAYVIYPYPTPSSNFHHVEPTFVEKKIRTYHLHHREKVSVLLLPGLPLSGQPKSDIKRDLATYLCDGAIRNRNRIRYVIYVCVFWLCFLFFSALYLLLQMYAFNAAMEEMGAGEELIEDSDLALMLFLIMTLVVAPVLALGGNFIKWQLYKHFVTKRASVKTGDLVKVVPKTVATEWGGDGDEDYDEEGMFCAPMKCGDANDADDYRAMN